MQVHVHRLIERLRSVVGFFWCEIFGCRSAIGNLHIRFIFFFWGVKIARFSFADLYVTFFVSINRDFENFTDIFSFPKFESDTMIEQ